MSDEIAKLKAQIARINERLDSMSSSFEAEKADTTYHVKEIHKRLIHIWDFLWPLLNKIFPGYADDAQKIAALSGSNSKNRPDK
jgi:hypothetical protein